MSTPRLPARGPQPVRGRIPSTGAPPSPCSPTQQSSVSPANGSPTAPPRDVEASQSPPPSSTSRRAENLGLQERTHEPPPLRLASPCEDEPVARARLSKLPLAQVYTCARDAGRRWYRARPDGLE